MGGAGKGQEHNADLMAQQSGNLGNQYNAQQQQMYNMLFGGQSTAQANPVKISGGSTSSQMGPTAAPGSGSSSTSGGALTPFLDPSSLNVTKPTGVYGLQYTNAKDTLANLYGKNAASIKSNATQAGFGANTPAGFTQSEENANARGLADSTGQAFTDATTQQYQEALANFWKSIGVASGAMQGGESGALTGTNNASQTYANLYGNAGRNSNIGSITGAIGGGVGGALAHV